MSSQWHVSLATNTKPYDISQAFCQAGFQKPILDQRIRGRYGSVGSESLFA